MSTTRVTPQIDGLARTGVGAVGLVASGTWGTIWARNALSWITLNGDPMATLPVSVAFVLIGALAFFASLLWLDKEVGRRAEG